MSEEIQEDAPARAPVENSGEGDPSPTERAPLTGPNEADSSDAESAGAPDRRLETGDEISGGALEESGPAGAAASDDSVPSDGTDGEEGPKLGSDAAVATNSDSVVDAFFESPPPTGSTTTAVPAEGSSTASTPAPATDATTDRATDRSTDGDSIEAPADGLPGGPAEVSGDAAAAEAADPSQEAIDEARSGRESHEAPAPAEPTGSSTDPFADLPAEFAQAFLAKGFTELTEVQHAVLRADSEGRDLRISSQTGSGKTVALGLVVAPKLLDRPKRSRKGNKGRRPATPQVLLVAPTRELAHQLGEELSWMYAGHGVRLATVTGGTSIHGDLRALGDQPDLLVGTPGRLVDHLERGTLDLLSIDAVVLDEADEMLDMGFREELERILDATPHERSTHLVSATLPRKVLQLADAYQTDPLLIEGTTGQSHSDIEHVIVPVTPHERTAALINFLLLHPEERILVFVNSRVGASGVAGELSGEGFSAAALSGEMAQRERTRTLEDFRRRRVQCLVATDVAARGLDITGVQLVVHFDLPRTDDTFTHRSGRTGRAGEQGQSLLLVAPRARRRIESNLRNLGIDPVTRWPPTPEEILAGARERLLERFGADEADGTADAVAVDHRDPRLHQMARDLLAQRDPEQLVIDLLEAVGVDGPAPPRDIGRRAPRESAQGGPRRESGPGDRQGQHGDPRKRSRGVGGPASSDDYVAFHLTWGSKTGATPPRLLAHVCRRGGVSGDDVGAMQIRDFQSVVDVRVDAAKEFEKAVKRPDPRNPRVRISRFVARGGRPGRGPGRPPGGPGSQQGPRGRGPGPGNKSRGNGRPVREGAPERSAKRPSKPPSGKRRDRDGGPPRGDGPPLGGTQPRRRGWKKRDR